VKHITPLLTQEGIFMYGLDTLEDDNGLRVISEINTLSVGGISPAAKLSGRNLGQTYADLFINFVNSI
jgi:glutathione synthase